MPARRFVIASVMTFTCVAPLLSAAPLWAEGVSGPLRIAQAAQPATATAQQAQPAAPVPVRTEILRFDGWMVTCNDFDSPKKRLCEARLQFVQSNTNQVLLVWTVWLNDAKQLQTRLQTPTGVTIAAGVELQPEKGAARKLAFEACETGFCLAGTVMDGTLVRDLSTSGSVAVTIQATNGNRARFNLQTKGFDKAYTALRG